MTYRRYLTPIMSVLLLSGCGGGQPGLSGGGGSSSSGNELVSIPAGVILQPGAIIEAGVSIPAGTTLPVGVILDGNPLATEQVISGRPFLVGTTFSIDMSKAKLDLDMPEALELNKKYK